MSDKHKKTILNYVFNALSIFVTITLIVPIQFVLISSAIVTDLTYAEEILETPNEISFSEVAWMGSNASSTDEWIELYNSSETDISLLGWFLVLGDDDPDVIGDNIKCATTTIPTIPAGGYFLLERTDDESVPDITADCIYSGALKNNETSLALYNATGSLIDLIDASNGWPAGDNSSKKTMQWCGESWVTSPKTPKAGCSEENNYPIQTDGPQCGNNEIETGEQCDDGNTSSKDGCSSSCQTEPFPTIKVCKFEDTEGDGVLGDNLPVKNWGVGLLDKENPTKIIDMEIVSLNLVGGDIKYTGDDGCVLFTDLTPGEYRAVEEARNNWIPTYARGKNDAYFVGSFFDIFTDLQIQNDGAVLNDSFFDVFVDITIDFTNEGQIEFYNYNTKYCGDGVVNQEWEQCDGGGETSSCTTQCQNPEDNMCRDLVLAQINVDDIINKENGNTTSNIFLGSSVNKIPEGTWFALFNDGSFIIDPNISLYEDVDGLAVERQEGKLRIVQHGSKRIIDIEHTEGTVVFTNAHITNVESDNVSGFGISNRLERGFDGTGVGEVNTTNDEVATSSATVVDYYLTTNTADDGFITSWKIVENCLGICGVKFEDQNLDGEQGDEEDILFGWDITLYEENSCVEGEEWADFVVAMHQGLQSGGGAISLDRSDANNALGFSQYDDTVNFYSLGIGGELILGFENLIKDFEGNDIRVVETSYGNQTCESYPEKINVYASQDGIVWHSLGTGCLDSEFDLGVAGLDWARYLKFVDDTNPNDPAFDGNQLIDGYDIDGVEIINCRSIQEVKTETTTEEGYCFVDIDEGNYFIAETVKDGWFNTMPIGAQTFFDGENKTYINFGNARKGSISGIKFFDRNKDGVMDENEIGLSDWIIELYKGHNGPWNESIPFATTTTAQDGTYQFNDIMPGETYSVIEINKDGWEQTYPNTEHKQHTIELYSGAVIENANFGNFSNFLGSIHGSKFEDFNGNGIRDNDDAGLSDWTIELYTSTFYEGTTTIEYFTSTTTTQDGTYSFYGLEPGTYEVFEVKKEGWIQTAPNVASDIMVYKKCSRQFFVDELIDCTPADFNGDGYITPLDTGEVITALTQYDLDGDRFITSSDVGELFAVTAKYDLTNDGILDYRLIGEDDGKYSYIIVVAPDKAHTGYDFGNIKIVIEDDEDDEEQNNDTVPTSGGGGGGIVGGGGVVLLGELGGGQGGAETGLPINNIEVTTQPETTPATLSDQGVDTGNFLGVDEKQKGEQIIDENDTNGQVAALGFLNFVYECGIWHTILAFLILLAMALYSHARHGKTKEGIIAFIIGAIIVWFLGAYNCSWLLAFLAFIVVFLIGLDMRHTKNTEDNTPKKI